jgi:hypothetical protein
LGPTSDDEPDEVQLDALLPPGAAAALPPTPQSSGIGAGTIIPAALISGPGESFGPFAAGGFGPSFGGILPSSVDASGPLGGNSDVSFPGVVPPTTVLDIPPVILPPGGGTNGGGGGGGTPPDFPFTPPGTDPLPPLIVDVPPVIDLQPTPPTDAAPVPEPGTLLLIGSGIATMLARRRNS